LKNTGYRERTYIASKWSNNQNEALTN